MSENNLDCAFNELITLFNGAGHTDVADELTGKINGAENEEAKLEILETYCVTAEELGLNLPIGN